MPVSEWSFFTNHAHVLFCVAREPGMRLRDIADCVGITERATQRIVTELEDSGYLTRHRNGARNTYEVHPDLPIRDQLESHVKTGDFLHLLLRTADKGSKPSTKAS